MSEFAFLGTATADAWDEWTFDNAVNDAGTVRLRRERLPAYVDPHEVVDLEATASAIVDIDGDECDDLYLLRESGRVERYDPDTGRLVPLGCDVVGPPEVPARALAVTADTIYVASGSDPAAGADPEGHLTAVAKHPKQRRWTTTTSKATPVAMATGDDRVFVLLATADGGVLDVVAPAGDRSPVVEGVPAPLDVAFDAGGSGYLLGAPDDRRELRRVDLAALDPDDPVVDPPIWSTAVPAGATCLAAGEDNELLVGRHGGANGAVTLARVRASGREELASSDRDLDRLHLGTDLYAVADGGRTVLAFDARERYRRHETTGEQTGSVVRSFDSGEQAIEWHRVTLGFSVADAGTQVRLSYAATDDPVQARNVEWRTVDPANPHDALLTDAVGQYLWVRIHLQGERFASPRLHTVRAYFPQQSYLRYLPAIYQEDAESRAFLQQFLSVFESTFVGVEEDIDRITQYFDPQGVPPAFLGWLADWLALSTDETWPEEARRDLLDAAPALFRDRGTPNGLLDLLGLYLEYVSEPSPAWAAVRAHQLETVDERMVTGQTDGGVASGRPTSESTAEEHLSGALSTEEAETLRRQIESDVFLLEYGDLDCATGSSRRSYERLLDCPQCFFVFIRPFVDDDEFESVQRLIDEHRPANAVGRAVELEPSIVLGGHAYLGVNSVLPDRNLVVGEGSLGRDSVLDSHEAGARLGSRSVLGGDTELS